MGSGSRNPPLRAARRPALPREEALPPLAGATRHQESTEPALAAAR